MKKFLAGIAAAAIITIPMTSFALESMSKGALKKATGQAGVSIALDNVIIVQKSQPTTTYWDVDGTSSLGGTIGVGGSAYGIHKAGVRIDYTDAAQKLIVIDGILDNNKYGTANLESTFDIAGQSLDFGIETVGIAATGTVSDPSTGVMANAVTHHDAVTHVATAADVAAGLAAAVGDTVTDVAAYDARNYQRGISPLTIDVGTCEALSTGLQYNSAAATLGHLQVAGVVIGLPTIEITTYHSNDTKIITVETEAPNVANNGSTFATVSKELIRIEKSGTSQMAILGGRLEIAPH